MKSIKVCHVTSAHNAKDVRIYEKECIALSEFGFNVYIIAPNANNEIFNNINFVGVPIENKSRLYRMLLFTKKIYKKALEINADVYHIHDPEMLPYALNLKRKGKIVIYDIHEDLPRSILSKPYLSNFSKKIVSYFIEKYENKIARKLNYNITATPFIRNRFLKINKNTIDINNYPNFITEFQTNEINKKNQVCYIGGISKIRGINEIIESVKDLNTKLIIAGDIENLELKNILNNSKNVDYVGKLSRENLNKLMLSSKAGIVTFLGVPNHINAQPNKIFEYMSASLPVIASNFPLWKEIIEGNNCGICVDPTSPKEIANAIEFLINNEDNAKAMGENGKKAVLNKYNWDNEKIKLIDVYNQLLKSKS